MKPADLLGGEAWQRLKQGSVLSGVTGGTTFKTAKTGWLRWIVNVINPHSWVRIRKGNKQVVGLLRQRAVVQCKDERLVTLKMAAAGLVKINAIAFGGRLVTTPARKFDQAHIETFCDLGDSPERLIEKVSDPDTRIKLRELFFAEVLSRDIATLEEYPDCKPPIGLSQSPLQEQLSKRLGRSVRDGLYTLASESQIADCLKRVKAASRLAIDAQSAFRFSLDQLMVRTWLARAGLITEDEMIFSYQYFLNTLSRHPKLSEGIAKDFLDHPERGTLLMKMAKKFSENPKITTPEPVRRQRAVTKAASPDYHPNLERASRSPGLQNLGNKCYYNSMIKLLSNQFSMDELNALGRRPRRTDVSERTDGPALLEQRQKLYTSLINLLKAIKQCRAGLVSEQQVNQLNRSFVTLLEQCRGDKMIKELFSRASQEDAQEFAQVVNKILNHTENPRFSCTYRTRKTLTMDGKRYPNLVQSKGDARETMIMAGMESGKEAAYDACLKRYMEPEERTYLWEPGDEKDIGLDIEDILTEQKAKAGEIGAALEAYKNRVERETDDQVYIREIQAMTFNPDTGYFERPNSLDKEGNPKKLIFPPWVKTSYEPVYEADPNKLESVMMMPKIFRHGRFGASKLSKEAKVFFESCLDGVAIPCVDTNGKSLNLTMQVAGMSCHIGNRVGGGHYVYVERTSDGWVLHNDSVVERIGDDQALKKYFGNRVTPYVYHLEKTGFQHTVTGQPNEPVRANRG